MTTNKTGFFRSATAVLLALIMLLSVLPVSAETEAAVPDQSLILPEGVEEATLPVTKGSARPNGSTYNNDSAFSTYVKNALYSRTDSVLRSAASSVLGSRLNKEEKALYDALLKKIQSVANGKASSTHFKVSFSPKFTLKSVKNSKSVLNNKIRAMVINVTDALLGDGPCELYWFDKTEGWAWDYNIQYNRTHCWITNFSIDFYVAKEYSAHNTTRSTKINTSKAKSVQAAAANAKKIVKDNRGKSDVEKLRAYKNEICRLNEYNQAAGKLDSDIPYGNPWQLVWVFDGDPNTKVVCEGYSKAFQYLCELSSFSGDVTCLSMGGFIFDAYDGGPHMWNVVKMPDKKQYLVDVTWSDIGNTGSDYLFLTGCIGTIDVDFNYKTMHYDKAYVFITDSNNSLAAYCFDTDAPIYKASDRNLSPNAFNLLSDTTKASGKCGADAEWSLNKGVLKIQGNGKMANYKSGSPAPWKKYAGSIKKIVIGDSITEIGKYAFDGLKAATSVTIGEKVKKIGNYAFNGCKKLKAFTFKGDKLKTIGSNAFKGLPKKVTFNCPSKKLAAYKKLLLKKGAPKNASFKKK